MRWILSAVTAHKLLHSCVSCMHGATTWVWNQFIERYENRDPVWKGVQFLLFFWWSYNCGELINIDQRRSYKLHFFPRNSTIFFQIVIRFNRIYRKWLISDWAIWSFGYCYTNIQSYMNDTRSITRRGASLVKIIRPSRDRWAGLVGDPINSISLKSSSQSPATWTGW